MRNIITLITAALYLLAFLAVIFVLIAAGRLNGQGIIMAVVAPIMVIRFIITGEDFWTSVLAIVIFAMGLITGQFTNL